MSYDSVRVARGAGRELTSIAVNAGNVTFIIPMVEATVRASRAW